MAVLGSGRGLNGRGAPVGSIWAEFQLKRSHGDPFRDRNKWFWETSSSLVLISYHLVLTSYNLVLTNDYLVVTIDSLVLTNYHLVLTSYYLELTLTPWYYH